MLLFLVYWPLLDYWTFEVILDFWDIIKLWLRSDTQGNLFITLIYMHQWSNTTAEQSIKWCIQLSTPFKITTENIAWYYTILLKRKLPNINTIYILYYVAMCYSFHSLQYIPRFISIVSRRFRFSTSLYNLRENQNNNAILNTHAHNTRANRTPLQ
jgi:hypothetical protein